MMKRLAILLVLVPLTTCINAQDSTNIGSRNKIEKYLNAVVAKSSRIQKKLTKESATILSAMQKEEEKLRLKLSTIDSVAAINLFAQSAAQYKFLRQKASEQVDEFSSGKLSNYIPFLDTLNTSIRFLNGGTSVLPISMDGNTKVKEALEKVTELKGKFDQAGSIQKFIRERRQYLKEQLSKFGLAKNLKKLSKKAYYYSQFVKNYKEILCDPKKIEKFALAFLSKMPAFQTFMQKNSTFASIFGASSTPSPPVILVGVQTRASVQSIIANSNPLASVNPSSYVVEQFDVANQSIAADKEKLLKLPPFGQTSDIPGFKPNEQKTKPFLERLEFNVNMQIGKLNGAMPGTGDFAVSVGYKLNSSVMIGIGSSYRLGFGSLSKIHFTHEGIGLRSSIDWKMKGNIYVAGGYERNYLPRLAALEFATPVRAWQESGLIGISKKITVQKKRKVTMSLFFDFLSYQNYPRSQPLVFRTGFSF